MNLMREAYYVNMEIQTINKKRKQQQRLIRHEKFILEYRFIFN